MELVVGMGEYAISDNEGDVLRTFALASCVAVTAYSPLRQASGMIHVVLPTPFDARDAALRPQYFAVTGVPLLINSLCTQYGCRREELHIQMFGGATSITGNDVFEVGRHNIEAVRRTLMGMGLSIVRADLRGTESRTLEMNVKTGEIKVSRNAM